MARSYGWKGWTQKELDTVEEMKLEGKTNLEISKILGRSEDSVNAICYKRQFRRCLLTPKIYLQVFLTNPQSSNREIAKIVGVQRETVKKARQRLRAMGYSI